MYALTALGPPSTTTMFMPGFAASLSGENKNLNDQKNKNQIKEGKKQIENKKKTKINGSIRLLQTSPRMTNTVGREKKERKKENNKTTNQQKAKDT